MSETQPAWQIDIYALILHSTEARTLLLAEQDGWTLPYIQLTEGFPVSQTNIVCQAIHARYGLQTTVLQCVQREKETLEHLQKQQRMYILENHDPTWIPPTGSRWIGLQELEGLPLKAPEQLPLLKTCLQGLVEDHHPSLRPAWTMRGWFAWATAWIRPQLSALGYTIDGPIEQLYCWGISSVLRIPTTTGKIYFKTSLYAVEEQLQAQKHMGRSPLPLLFGNEAVLTRYLSTLYPDQVPRALAIEPQQAWMLMQDFGSVLGQYGDRTVWLEPMRTYSRMQIASVQHIEALLETGFQDRRLEKLLLHIPTLLSDTALLADDGLDASEIEQLRQYEPLLKTLCQQLATYNVPEALVHGDLHGSNIALQEGKYVFFDWTDGCIAHPFFDLAIIPDAIEVQGKKRSLHDIYLEQWTMYESSSRLHEAYDIALVLAHIHQMISYQHLLANLDDSGRIGLQGGLSFWARGLLQSLAKRKE